MDISKPPSSAAAPRARLGSQEPGAVLLISCYELGHQPMGLAWPLAFLERAGFRPACLDLATQRLDEDAVRRARLVAISVPMHTALRLGVRAAHIIRRINPGAMVVFFGLYATLNAEYLLMGLADAVVGGEAEGELVEWAQRLERGGEGRGARGDVRGQGPGFGGGGALTVGFGQGPGPAMAKLDFPVPSRQRLPPLSSYARFRRGGEEHVAGYVEASRGCLHHCRHCPIPPVYGGRLFVVPREVVLQDVRQQVALGARHITFGDPDFLNGPGHSLKIARALHAQFPNLSFDFTAKVEHLLRHHRLLPELRDLGCAFIVSAVESLSDVVLANLDKGHTKADVERLVPLVRAAGIALRPSLLPFTPWAGPDDYFDILDWVAHEGLVEHVDPVQYTIRLLVPPGSALLGTPALAPHLDGLDQESFTWRWTHPDPRMDALHAEVSALVKRAARAQEHAASTFERIWKLASGMLGPGRVAGPYNRPLLAGAGTPRLTEPWFC